MRNLRALFGLAVIAAAIYMTWKVVPAYVNNYQFASAIDDTARMGTIDDKKSEEDLRAAVLQQAQELGIPVKVDDIKVAREGYNVLISADYVVHVDVPVYPFDLTFHPSSKREELRFK